MKRRETLRSFVLPFLFLMPVVFAMGCASLTDQKVLTAIGTLPDDEKGILGEGLLLAVDQMEKKLTKLEKNIRKAKVAEGYLTVRSDQINRKYENQLRLLNYKVVPGEVSTASAEIKRLMGREILEAWAEESIQAAADAEAIKTTVANVRASVASFKEGLEKFKDMDDLEKLKAFNEYIKQAGDLIVNAHKLRVSIENHNTLSKTLAD